MAARLSTSVTARFRLDGLLVACRQTRMFAPVESLLTLGAFVYGSFKAQAGAAPCAILAHVSSKHSRATVLYDGTKSQPSPFCDRPKSPFNFALNGRRFALPVDGPCTRRRAT